LFPPLALLAEDRERPRRGLAVPVSLPWRAPALDPPLLPAPARAWARRWEQVPAPNGRWLRFPLPAALAAASEHSANRLYCRRHSARPRRSRDARSALAQGFPTSAPCGRRARSANIR